MSELTEQGIYNKGPSTHLCTVPLDEPYKSVAEQMVVGESVAYSTAKKLVSKVGKTSATVLFLGEPGVGKERFAQLLHTVSKRSNKPFITLHCAAIPYNLIESELLGVCKGAYSSEPQAKQGKIEAASGGTLFLDEIDTLPMPVQVKLLRVIQAGEYKCVGSSSIQKCDVRIVAATDSDLSESVKRGTFRSDLFFKLNVFPIEIPPLRKRKEDIALLMGYFLKKYAHLHEKTLQGFSRQAIEAMNNYNFPGNIRELESKVERAIILADDGQFIESSHLFDMGSYRHESTRRHEPEGAMFANELPTNFVGDSPSLLDTFISSNCSLSDLERDIMSEAVKHCEGNIAQAARLLGLTRPQMAYRLKKMSSDYID